MKKFSQIIKQLGTMDMRVSLGITPERDKELMEIFAKAFILWKDKVFYLAKKGNKEELDKLGSLPEVLLCFDEVGYQCKDEAEMIFVIIKAEQTSNKLGMILGMLVNIEGMGESTKELHGHVSNQATSKNGAKGMTFDEVMRMMSNN